MKSSKKIICTVLAVLMAASSLVIGSVSASAASVKAPKKVTVTNAKNGVKVKWSKVSGAKKYMVYRNNKKVLTTKKTAFTDASSKAGKAYTYKVKAVKGKVTSKAKASKKIMRMNLSKISSVANVATGVKVKWLKRTAATKYLVYRKTTGAYTKIASVKGALTYTDTAAKSGVKYTYLVKCYNSATKSYATGNAMSRFYLAQPANVTARENVDLGGITVNWAEVTGAQTYAIYRQKCTEGAFTKIATVEAGTLTYNDKDAAQVNPTAYMYKVVALKGTEKSTASQFRLAPYAAKSDENRYYRDAQNNIHVKIYLNKGESYAEGKALADYLSLGGQYQATVTEGADKVTVDNGVITAVDAGNAVVTVTISDAAKDMVNGLANTGANKLSTKTVYVEVTVK